MVRSSCRHSSKAQTLNLTDIVVFRVVFVIMLVASIIFTGMSWTVPAVRYPNATRLTLGS